MADHAAAVLVPAAGPGAQDWIPLPMRVDCNNGKRDCPIGVDMAACILTGQVPGHGEPWQAFEIQAYRPGAQAKHLPHAHKVTQAGSTNRYGEARVQFVHGIFVPMVCGDVADTGHTTFRDRGLETRIHGCEILRARGRIVSITQFCTALVSFKSPLNFLCGT